jgi:FkbM family methyltransferase
VSRMISLTLFAHRRSRLRHFPRLQRWLRRVYLQQRSWAIRLDDDMILCRVLGRFKLFADPQDRSISPHLMMDGYWEPRTTETIVDLMRRGMVAIDVGANLGYFTLLMAGLAGEKGRVLSFEPNPRTAKRLQASVMLSGFQDRVDFHPVVLGDSDGKEINLLLSVDHPGGTHVTALTPDNSTTFLTARTRRLDGIAGALDATLVKIDAEGAEEAIWHGMTAMIAGKALRYVIVEFSPSAYKDPAGLLDEVEAAGFTISCIDDERSICPISRAEILDGTPQRMLIFQR